MKNLKTKENNNKGITLVALVISIIVLLILATVSISLVMNGGIIDKSKSSVDKYSEAEISEQIKQAYLEYEMAKLTGMTENASDFIKNRLDESYGSSAIDDVNKIGNSLMVTFSNGKIYTYNTTKGIIADITNMTNISKSADKNYVGCYADIDTDGNVDGIIFADLLTGSTIEVQDSEWSSEIYTIEKVNSEELKNYYISKESEDGIFGVEKVLSPKGTGKNRFYVMSLQDFNSDLYTTFYWYNNAKDKMNASDTTVVFGSGKTNTDTMINKWNLNGKTGGYLNAVQDNEDIWKHIQKKASEGWFIPSLGEWIAFYNEMKLTNSDVRRLNIYWFWTSSQANSSRAYLSPFNGSAQKRIIGEKYHIRLATTF